MEKPKRQKFKVGLIGFGKTGKAVANVILQNKIFASNGFSDRAIF
jgi:homoserine dehydrogenase